LPDAVRASTYLVDRRRRRRCTGQVCENPPQHGVPREVSRTTKHFRRLFDEVLDDDGQPMVWASSHTFRRTGITTLHEAGVPDRTIVDHSGHRRLQVLQDHYLARRRVSTTAADLLPAPRRS
jgi:integrase